NARLEAKCWRLQNCRQQPASVLRDAMKPDRPLVLRFHRSSPSEFGLQIAATALASLVCAYTLVVFRSACLSVAHTSVMGPRCRWHTMHARGAVKGWLLIKTASSSRLVGRVASRSTTGSRISVVAGWCCSLLQVEDHDGGLITPGRLRPGAGTS